MNIIMRDKPANFARLHPLHAVKMPLNHQQKGILQALALARSEAAELRIHMRQLANLADDMGRLATVAMSMAAPEGHDFVPDPDVPSVCEACGLAKSDPLHDPHERERLKSTEWKK